MTRAKGEPFLPCRQGREGRASGRARPCTSAVDREKRRAVARNHTATHLLQFALRQVLGEHVKQSGSLVERDRLRFDFTHFQGLAAEEVATVEDIVNGKILDTVEVRTDVKSSEEAIREGATALFEEKYGETVRVVSIGDFSRELCGGTHVRNTGEIGSFSIVGEGSLASGVRRIEAVTGMGAVSPQEKDRGHGAGRRPRAEDGPRRAGGEGESAPCRARRRRRRR